MTGKEIAIRYQPADFYRWPGPLTHASFHDPLWLHNFGQPGYQTVPDYGQHVARVQAELAEYVSSGRQQAALERYQAALASLKRKPKAKPAQPDGIGIAKPKPHDCGEPGNPVAVAQCPNCWDAEDERHAVRHIRG